MGIAVGSNGGAWALPTLTFRGETASGASPACPRPDRNLGPARGLCPAAAARTHAAGDVTLLATITAAFLKM